MGCFLLFKESETYIKILAWESWWGGRVYEWVRGSEPVVVTETEGGMGGLSLIHI